ncbi:SoxR reducing system RseC family protein [Halanaerocella petrolearia]
MKEIGKVMVNKGKVAIVKIERHSACSKCKKNCELAKDHEQDELLVEVNNEIGAYEGQRVKLELEGSNLVSAALLVYSFPLLALVGGYFIGDKFIIQQGEVGGIIGAIVFLVLSVVVIKILGRKMNPQSKITEIID